ncbi:hypothetical protein FB645_004464 [Coemansia sp. IMI 203386]|nr:hypothetical protein FB645_004464 [Coemansia sp. IMI 203386]
MAQLKNSKVNNDHDRELGFYFQAKEEMKLGELRKIKLEEMRRLNQEALAAGDAADSSKKQNSSDQA